MKFEKKLLFKSVVTKCKTKQIDDVCIFSFTICDNHLLENLCGFELKLNMFMGQSITFLIGGSAIEVDVETIAKVGNEYQGGY